MRGWEGLYGRPRPVPLAHILGEHDHTPPRYGSSGPVPGFPASVDVYWATLAVAHQASTKEQAHQHP